MSRLLMLQALSAALLGGDRLDDVLYPPPLTLPDLEPLVHHPRVQRSRRAGARGKDNAKAKRRKRKAQKKARRAGGGR